MTVPGPCRGGQEGRGGGGDDLARARSAWTADASAKTDPSVVAALAAVRAELAALPREPIPVPVAARLARTLDALDAERAGRPRHVGRDELLPGGPHGAVRRGVRLRPLGELGPLGRRSSMLGRRSRRPPGGGLGPGTPSRQKEGKWARSWWTAAAGLVLAIAVPGTQRPAPPAVTVTADAAGLASAAQPLLAASRSAGTGAGAQFDDLAAPLAAPDAAARCLSQANADAAPRAPLAGRAVTVVGSAARGDTRAGVLLVFGGNPGEPGRFRLLVVDPGCTTVLAESWTAPAR